MMSAGCAQCGNCCDPVTLSADVYLELGQQARSQENPHPDAVFITQHWHPLWASAEDGGTVLVLRCDAFDPETRLCTAHENRPPVCRDYPWYGDGPNAKTYLQPDCSYAADLPPGSRAPGSRPLIPLTVVGA